MKLGMISLGCAKNQIDTELFLGVTKAFFNSLIGARGMQSLVNVHY